MATRAPRTSARPRSGGGSGGRPRSPAAGARRPRTSGSGRGGRQGKGAYGKGKGKGRGRPSGRSRYDRRPPSANPIVILLGWIASVLAAAWMAVAHTVGTAARALGHSARDLDPLHRRDGAGLGVLAAALIAAAVTWWHLSGTLGRGLSDLLRGAFGSAAWTIPILLVLLAWRLLRHPDKNADTARMVIGWTALIIGALGLLHLASGTPAPADGASAMRAGGGIIGYLASAPLVAVLTAWVTAPVLALVIAFGLLVITGTPLHQVPARLAELAGFLRGHHPDDGRDGEPGQGAGRLGPGGKPGTPAGPGRAASAGAGSRRA